MFAIGHGPNGFFTSLETMESHGPVVFALNTQYYQLLLKPSYIKGIATPWEQRIDVIQKTHISMTNNQQHF